jgi:glycyl-tRNA synthetase beta chain
MAVSLRDAIVALLVEHGLEHGDATWLGTPRRLTVHVAAVQSCQPDRVDQLTGPPAAVAFQADGTATRAGEGFARGQGMGAADLFTVETAKGSYAALRKQVVGQGASALLESALPGLLRALPQPKKMRWGRQPEAFIRPVHWIVALFGEEQLQFEFAGVKAGRQGEGHRFFGTSTSLRSADIDSYTAALQAEGVTVDPAVRKRQIVEGARALATEAGGTLVEDDELADVVTWLVEAAGPLLGTFEPRFLDLPDAVTITTLKSHQKLFTIRRPDGRLLNRFVAVANTLTEESRQEIAQGNDRVVSARLSDALFFYEQDLKQKLEDYGPMLSRQVYLQGLGSMSDKVGRIVALAGGLAETLCPDQHQTTVRAAQLCKADLATRLVIEFTSLQGEIGEQYAVKTGESTAVGQAIREHHLPRFSDDALPTSKAGAIVAVADKIDAIVGCFSLGLIPTGTQDPYALRRQALGVLHIVADQRWSLSLSNLIDRAIAGLGDDVVSAPRDGLEEQVLDFFRGRLKSLHQGRFAADLVESVLAADFERIATIEPRLEALQRLRQGEDFEPLAAAFKRVANIVRKAPSELDRADVDPALLQETAERALYDGAESLRGVMVEHLGEDDFEAALGHLVTLKPAVDRFFDEVLVMSDDDALRVNRLALMRHVGGLFSQIADFARIQSVREAA